MKNSHFFLLPLVLLLLSFGVEIFSMPQLNGPYEYYTTRRELKETTYRCVADNEDGCGGEIQKKDIYEVILEDEAGNIISTYEEEEESIYEDLPEWQACDPENEGDWQDEIPEYDCAGECLETPTNPGYYRDSQGTIPQEGRVDLPVRLEWDNVEGWGEEGGPRSYNVRISGDDDSITRNYLGIPGAVDPFPDIPEPPDTDLFIWPLLPYETHINPTSDFGRDRRDVDLGPFHGGTDFGSHPVNTPGNPILAPADGEVIFTGTIDGYSLVLEHQLEGMEDPIYTRYLHLQGYIVEEEQTVTQGEQIATMGGSGGSGAAIDMERYPVHLHIDVCTTPNCQPTPESRTHLLNYVDPELTFEDSGELIRPYVIDSLRDGRNCGHYASGYCPIYVQDQNLPAEEVPRNVYQEPNNPNISSNPNTLSSTQSFGNSLSNFILASQNSSYSSFEANTYSNSLNAESCLLRTNNDYDWGVRACCNPDGTDCGEESDWSFGTSEVPEPFSPYDPGWSDPNTKAGDQRYEFIGFEDADLGWCEMEKDDPRILDFPWIEEKSKPEAYKVRLYVENEQGEYICHPRRTELGQCEPFIVRSSFVGEAPTELRASELSDYITINTNYAWEVAACSDVEREHCTDYSQRWKFILHDSMGPPTEKSPPHDPEGDDFLSGIPARFSWSGPQGAQSYQFQFYEGEEMVVNTFTERTYIELEDLEINSDYRWRIRSCWGDPGILGTVSEEECEDQWSDFNHFRTTGRRPQAENIEDATIPTTISWEDVPGADSYNFRILEGGEKIREESLEESEITLDYPDIKPETTYLWFVKTCAATGECGRDLPPYSLTTFSLEPPEELDPIDEEIPSTQRSINLSWDEVRGANFYKYEIAHAEGEEECISNRDTGIIPSTTTPMFFLRCLGEYNWKVYSCLDENCEEKSDASYGNFTYTEPEATGVGLVPCGMPYGSPDTPWDETEPCQVKHLLILFKVIIDFLFWNLFPFILPIMMLVSGVIFYLSPTLGTDAMVRVGEVWKTTGKGLIIIFISWNVITIVLSIMGYEAGIYGPWWQIEIGL